MNRGLFGGTKRCRPPVQVYQFTLPQSLNTCYFLMQVLPAVRHGLQEIENTTAKHAITESCLICYLMGMGFDYCTALAIVESWESDEKLLAEGILCE
ncbi:MAG TPA: hypothetical protein PKA28_15880 [Methylomusa anaerophila]|uniref:Uncharacterized protein n=1 Tax=Methylomusa anaerophila TaxID=1930071 RepID=A0A348AK89_9FIRM|nr:hypothetical protein [Methylomusa anaerophila]BBB91487.1 hypothetical protein MAMMFC1_02171 [Methylomusa anaerophila]HML89924.1 hypothetical protein [Methylomusa anaerophila]